MPKISRIQELNLTNFRQENNLLQKELADFLGVSRGYISMVESGKSHLSKENIKKILSNKSWNSDTLTSNNKLSTINLSKIKASLKVIEFEIQNIYDIIDSSN